MFDATSPFEAGELSSPPDHAPALQRTRGALRLAFAAQDGISAVQQFYQEGALKARLPRQRENLPEAVVINTAGGLTGGDAVSITVAAGPGARAVISGQACEKIYKSVGGEAAVASTVTLAPGAALEWLVQPTILFDRARLRRTMDVNMAADAAFLGVEAIVFGRTAMDETVNTGFVSDSWSLRREGTLVYADTFRLDGDIGSVLAHNRVLSGGRAMANVIYAAHDAEARVDDMRLLLADIATAAASAWNGLLVARIAAADGYELTRSLVAILAGFRRRSMPRVWMM